jgi:exosortase A
LVHLLQKVWDEFMDNPGHVEVELNSAQNGILPKAIWRPYMAMLILGFAIITALFFSTAKEMIRVWEVSVAFQHCWLIPAVVAYLVWERRKELAKLQPRPWLPGLFLVGLAAFLWLIGWASSVNFIEEFGYVFMLQGLVVATLGPTVSRALVFPLAFMLFAVPFGEEFVPFLQKLTLTITIFLLKLFGLSFVNDGVFISVAIQGSSETHNFQIAQECSGIRYMTAMAATATLFANIGFISWTRRILLVFMAFTVAILANGIRAFAIVYIAHKTDMEYATGFDHIIYGWVFFALVMAIVIFIGYFMMDKPLDAPAIRVEPLLKLDLGKKFKHQFFWLGTAGSIVIAGLFNAYARHASVPPPTGSRLALKAPAIDGWTPTTISMTQWQPTYEGATRTFQQSYISKTGDVVSLFIAYYDYQSADREMIRFGNGTTGGDLNWTWARNSETPRLSKSPSPWAYQINGSGAVRDIYQWYWVNGKTVSSNGQAKLQGALARLFNREKGAITVIVSTDRFEADAAGSVLTDFSEKLGSIDALARKISAKK